MSVQPFRLPTLTNQQENLLGEVFHAFEDHALPDSGQNASLATLTQEGLELNRNFLRISNASERAVVIRLTQALAERTSANH